jgi:hypothetical protein
MEELMFVNMSRKDVRRKKVSSVLTASLSVAYHLMMFGWVRERDDRFVCVHVGACGGAKFSALFFTHLCELVKLLKR